MQNFHKNAPHGAEKLFGGYFWKSFPYKNPRKNQEKPTKNKENLRKTKKK